MKKFGAGIIFGLILVGSILSAGSVFAAAGSDTSPSGTSLTINLNDFNILGCAGVDCVLAKIFDALFTISVPICAIMILWGGFKMMTATGDPKKFSEARKIIFYAVVGFAVIASAKIITTLIQTVVVGTPSA